MTASTLFGFGHPALEFVAIVALQIAVLCAIAGALALRRRAAIRSRLWIGALLGCLAGPVLLGGFQLSGLQLFAVESPFTTAVTNTPLNAAAEIPTPAQAGRARPPQPTQPALAGPTPAGPLPTAVLPSGSARRTAKAPRPTTISTADVSWWALLSVWLIGSMVVIARIHRTRKVVGELRASSHPVNTRSVAHVLSEVQRTLGSKDLPEICHSSRVPQPMTLGGGRPMVVVPTELLQTLSPYQLRDILIHECGHVVQRDLTLGWVQAAAHAVFWWHPAIHIINRELGIAREELCDNRVLQVAAPASYARTLLELCERPQLQMGPLSCGLLPRQWSLKARVAGLLDSQRSTGLRTGTLRGVAALVGLLGVSAAIAGTGFRPRQDPVRSSPTANVKEQGTAETVRGVFTDAGGAPINGAQVALISSEIDGYLAAMGSTEADGGFSFDVTDRSEDFFRSARLLLRKPGVPLTWGLLREFRGNGRTIAAPAARPVQGRIVDLEGRPVPDVTVQVSVLYGSPLGTLDPWLETQRKPNVGLHENTYEHLTDEIRLWSLPHFLSSRTGPDGRFVLDDLGAERLADVRIFGSGIVSQQLYLLSSDREPFQTNLAGMGPQWGIAQIYGDVFEHHVARSRVVEGTVRNASTGQPLVGATVRSERVSPGHQLGWIKTVTDENGEYRLVGMPKGEGNTIKVTPRAGDPCFAQELAIPNPEGMDPVPLDIDLDQGVVIAGRVIDLTTGKGVHAMVRKFRKGEFSDQSFVTTAPDGSFQIIAAEGTVFLAASVRKESEAFEAIASRQDVSAWDTELGASMSPSLGIWHGAARVEVSEQRTQDQPITVGVKRGSPRKIRFVDQQGAPITGAWVLYANAGGRPESTPDDFWQISAAAASSTYGLVVQQLDLEVSALARISEDIPVESTVVLRPWATVAGRLVDALGKPRAGIRLVLSGVPPSGNGVCFFDAATKTSLHTGDDGTFLVEGLVEGLEYQLQLQESSGTEEMMFSDDVAFEGLTVTSGERKTLGDVQAKRSDR